MENKRLLYYYLHDISYSDEGFLVTFYFRDVLTGELVVINQSKDASVKNHYSESIFYDDIDEAKKDYVILWNNNSKYIAPINTPFEQVRIEYLNMINNGVEVEVANNFMKHVHLGVSKVLD